MYNQYLLGLITLLVGIIIIIFRKYIAKSKLFIVYDLIFYKDKKYLSSHKRIKDRIKMTIIMGLILILGGIGFFIFVFK